MSKCKFLDCNNNVYIEDSYCFEHKCIVRNCPLPILPHMLSLRICHRARTCDHHLCNSPRTSFRNSIYCPTPKLPQYDYCHNCKCIFQNCNKPKIYTVCCGSCGSTLVVSEFMSHYKMCPFLHTSCGVCGFKKDYEPDKIMYRTKKSNYCYGCLKYIHTIYALTKYCEQKHNNIYDIIKYIVQSIKFF